MSGENQWQARPTTYKGIQMRSRLEARFAQTIDKITDWRWSYEPECFADETGQYLPDFLIEHEGDRTYVEVKPTAALAQEWVDGPMRRIWSTHSDAHLMASYPNGEHWASETRHPQGWEEPAEPAPSQATGAAAEARRRIDARARDGETEAEKEHWRRIHEDMRQLAILECAEGMTL